eukprot:TRINITY_DN17686_c0_g1_i1.p4 TRINITY_DN17686_c0_g1~~TRINITY_DN17686_c0_g1_i1.p4  ORF type:complete len:113 (+),score=4.60 TRINITY_DN17686_c0_g1_i1:300-638(+)
MTNSLIQLQKGVVVGNPILGPLIPLAALLCCTYQQGTTKSAQYVVRKFRMFFFFLKILALSQFQLLELELKASKKFEHLNKQKVENYVLIDCSSFLQILRVRVFRDGKKVRI